MTPPHPHAAPPPPCGGHPATTPPPLRGRGGVVVGVAKEADTWCGVAPLERIAAETGGTPVGFLTILKYAGLEPSNLKEGLELGNWLREHHGKTVEGVLIEVDGLHYRFTTDGAPFTVCTTAASVQEAAEHLAEVPTVALDIETTHLRPWRGDIRLIQVRGTRTYILDLFHVDPEPVLSLLKEKVLIIHGADFELLWLRQKYGPEIGRAGVRCTLTASRILGAGGPDSKRNKLDQCLERYLGIEPSTNQQGGSDWGAMILAPEQIEYAARDVEYLHRLYTKQAEAIREAGLMRVWQLERQLLSVAVDMSLAGMHVDQDKLKELEAAARAAEEELAADIRERIGDPEFKLGNHEALRVWLNSRGLNLTSTDKDTLALHRGHTDVETVLAFRTAQNEARGYQRLLEALEADGRVHGSFNTTGADTGRFSSSKPNMQNIKNGEARYLFKAPPGKKLIVCDYSQVELRIVAMLAKDAAMLEAYRQDADLHTETARAVSGHADVDPKERSKAKAVNFGSLYGQGPSGLVQYARTTFGVTLTEQEAQEWLDGFYAAYPALAARKAICKQQSRAGLDEIRTITGRRRLMPATCSEWERFAALLNTPVQGAAGDAMKLALLLMHEHLPKGARLLSVVHDEAIVEAPENISENAYRVVVHCMKEALERLLPGIPAKVDGGVFDNWGDAK